MKLRTVMIHPVFRGSNPEDHEVIAAYRNKALAEKRIREQHQAEWPGCIVYVGKAVPLFEEHHL